MIHRFEAVGSTMEEARRLAQAGAAHLTVAVARVQTAGRGRGGRHWVSPPGNLHATVLLRPPPERAAPELGFVVALAVAEAADLLAGPGTALKWPNDVMRGGAKLAGILLERLQDGAVLAGVGANVAHVPPDLPYPVTSLAAEGSYADAESLLDAVLERLQPGWAAWRDEGFAPVLARWSARGPRPGAALRVRVGDGFLAGAFAGLAPSGALLLDTPAGRQTIVAGDVIG